MFKKIKDSIKPRYQTIEKQTRRTEDITRIIRDIFIEKGQKISTFGRVRYQVGEIIYVETISKTIANEVVLVLPVLKDRLKEEKINYKKIIVS